MPNYIYRCYGCELPDEEHTHSIHEDPEIMCTCGFPRVRVPQAPGISLKGDGWAGKTGGPEDAS